MWGRPLLYERLTWPEVRRAAGENRVCLIPVGTLEDHGSNQNLVEMAARLTMIDHPGVIAAAAFYLLSRNGIEAVEETRESGFGGMAHADELETSIYLAIDPDAVDMSKAVDEQGYPAGENARLEWWADGPLRLMPWWSSFSRTGVQGSPTLATAEKGKAFLEAAVAECVGYVRELLEKPLPQRRPPQEELS